MSSPPSQRLLSSSDLGEANRARVMRTLYRLGPLSRSELARRLGVSRATITTIVQPLVDASALVELPGRAVSRAGGKPPRPLWFGTDTVIGAVYLAANHMTLAVVGKDGAIGSATDIPYEADTEPDTREFLRGHFIQAFGGLPLLGVGMGLAGMVDLRSGTIIASYRAPALNGLPLAPLAASWLGVPTYIDHHPRVQAIGDQWFGLGRELDDFVSVYTGEVLGAGIVMGGHVVHGPGGAGGEAGHMVIDATGPDCECGRRGCWETLATLPWLRREAAMRGLEGASGITAETLTSQAASGNCAAQQLLEAYARNIADGIANLDQVLGLRNYIVHGDAVGGGEAMRQLLEENLADRAPHREDGGPSVLFAVEPDPSTILGAAGLVLAHEYQYSV